MTNCRYCDPLPCEEWHDAGVRIHAFMQMETTRYWKDELQGAKAEAKKLWKVRHAEKPDYRTEAQKQRARRSHKAR